MRNPPSGVFWCSINCRNRSTALSARTKAFDLAAVEPSGVATCEVWSTTFSKLFNNLTRFSNGCSLRGEILFGFAQFADLVNHQVADVVDLILGVESPQAKTDRAFRQRLGNSARSKDVRGLDRGRSAR